MSGRFDYVEQSRLDGWGDPTGQPKNSEATIKALDLGCQMRIARALESIAKSLAEMTPQAKEKREREAEAGRVWDEFKNARNSVIESWLNRLRPFCSNKKDISAVKYIVNDQLWPPESGLQGLEFQKFRLDWIKRIKIDEIDWNKCKSKRLPRFLEILALERKGRK